jgi:hypothetical protein
MQKCRHIFQFKICRNNDIFLPFTVSTSHLIQYSLHNNKSNNQYSLCIVRHCWFPQKVYPVINIITLFAIVSQCQYFIASSTYEKQRFAHATLPWHISTFRGYQILFSIRNPYKYKSLHQSFRKWI